MSDTGDDVLDEVPGEGDNKTFPKSEKSWGAIQDPTSIVILINTKPDQEITDPVERHFTTINVPKRVREATAAIQTWLSDNGLKAQIETVSSVGYIVVKSDEATIQQLSQALDGKELIIPHQATATPDAARHIPVMAR